MNKYKETLYAILSELFSMGPEAYNAIEKLQGLLNDQNLLMVNKNCLPLTFEKKRLPEYLFNPKNPELEYSINLRLSSKQIMPVLEGPNEELVEEKLTKDMYYYLENLDYPRDTGEGFQVFHQEDYFKKENE